MNLALRRVHQACPDAGALQYQINPASSIHHHPSELSVNFLRHKYSMLPNTRIPCCTQAQAQVPDMTMTENRREADKWSTYNIPNLNVWDYHSDTDVLMDPNAQANRMAPQVRFVDWIGADRFSFQQK